MVPQIEPAEIETLATDYTKQYAARQLYDMLLIEWLKAQGETVPTRGELREYLAGIGRRLQRKIAQQQVAASPTLGFVTSQVINWAESAGIDVAAYRIPIAIFVALIAQAAFEELDERSK